MGELIYPFMGNPYISLRVHGFIYKKKDVIEEVRCVYISVLACILAGEKYLRV